MLGSFWQIEVFTSATFDIYTFLGDARFASITYRLFKLPPGTKTEPTQVRYK